MVPVEPGAVDDVEGVAIPLARSDREAGMPIGLLRYIEAVPVEDRGLR